MPASDYLEMRSLKHAMAKEPFPFPEHVYIALLTATIDKTFTGATLPEPTYEGYKRELINSAELEEILGGPTTASSLLNKLIQNLPVSTGGVAIVEGYAIVDDPATGAGNVHFFNRFEEAFEITPEALVIRIKAKALAVSAE